MCANKKAGCDELRSPAENLGVRGVCVKHPITLCFAGALAPPASMKMKSRRREEAVWR